MRYIKWFIFLSGILLASHAFAQQNYPNGTVMTESFGNTTNNPTTCPDGSTDACIQPWYIDQGSGFSIVSSPCTGGGSGNALELPAASTVPEIETTGSFPAISTSANWTMTLKVCIAASVSGYQTLLRLNDVMGGSVDAAINVNGTGFESVPGYTLCSGAGAGVLNTLVLSKSSGTVTWTINGVQCGSTFSDNGYAITDVQLAGMTTSSANVFIQSIQITGAGSLNGSFPPSFFIDFNGQAGNTVNTANLQAGTECNGNAISGTSTIGAWTISTLTGLSFVFPATSQEFAANLSACGGSFSGNTSSSVEMEVTTTSGSAGELNDEFTSVYPTISVGFYTKITSSGIIGSGIGLDFMALVYPDGYNLQWQDGGSGTYKICFENDEGGGTAPCTSTTISAGTWVWATFDMTGTGGTNHAWIYAVNANGSIGSLIGELTESGTHEPTAGNAPSILVGKTGSENMSNAQQVYYSNIILDLAAANAPLMPPSASLGSSEKVIIF